MQQASQPVSSPATSADDDADEEARLPFSGYMDFHFNKPAVRPAQLDFHRFVLLFGHSFSDRIKFWSELELEQRWSKGRRKRGSWSSNRRISIF